MFRTLLELGRISNLPTVWTNLLAGWVLGGGALALSEGATLGWLFLAGSLLYLAGMTLNDAAGIEFDKEHRPERPIPRGVISERTVWTLGWAYLLAGAAVFLLKTETPWYFVLAIVALILGYTFTHKRSSGCIYLMGGVRAMLYVIGAGAVIHGSLAAALWGLVLGFYVVTLTWVAKGESIAGKAREIPAAIWILPPLGAVLASFLSLGRFGVIPLVASVAYLLWLTWARRDLRAGRIGPSIGKLLAGMVLVDALAVAPHQPYLALALFVVAPLLLFWQRFVAAT